MLWIFFAGWNACMAATALKTGEIGWAAFFAAGAIVLIAVFTALNNGKVGLL